MADRLAIRPEFAAVLTLLTLALTACGTLNNQGPSEYDHIPTAGEVRGADPSPSQNGGASWFDSWWPFGENDPIRPASYTITQYTVSNLADKNAERENQRTLKMNLLDGRTTYIDIDQAVYPMQVEETTYRQIKSQLTEEAWKQQEKVKLPDTVTADQVTFYEITVTQVDDAPKVTTRFYVPREAPLPTPLKTIIDTWQHLHRQVHPISNRVDLLGMPEDK